MDSGKDIFEACNYLLTDLPYYVRQIGIWVSYLDDADKIPVSLFDSAKKIRLRKTIDEINERFGPHTLRNGFLLDAPKLTTVPNGFLSDRFERGRFAKEQSDLLRDV